MQLCYKRPRKYVHLIILPHICNLRNRSRGETARHALILTLLRCLLPFLVNLVSIITCINTFVDLSYNLTEVNHKTKSNNKGCSGDQQPGLHQQRVPDLPEPALCEREQLPARLPGGRTSHRRPVPVCEGSFQIRLEPAESSKLKCTCSPRCWSSPCRSASFFSFSFWLP